eukprot:gene6239-7480_t
MLRTLGARASGLAAAAVATANPSQSSAEARTSTASKTFQQNKIDDDWTDLSGDISRIFDNLTDQEVEDAYKTSFELSQVESRDMQLEILPEPLPESASDSDAEDLILGHSTQVMEAAERQMMPREDPQDFHSGGFARMVQRAFLQNPEVQNILMQLGSSELGLSLPEAQPALPSVEVVEEESVQTPPVSSRRPRSSVPGIHLEGSLDEAVRKMSGAVKLTFLNIRKQAHGVLDGLVHTLRSFFGKSEQKQAYSTEEDVQVELLAVDGESIRVRLGTKSSPRSAPKAAQENLEKVMQRTMAMVVLVLAIVLFRRVGIVRAAR